MPQDGAGRKRFLNATTQVAIKLPIRIFGCQVVRQVYYQRRFTSPRRAGNHDNLVADWLLLPGCW